MSNNPFSAAKDEGDFATRNSKFDIGRVTQVQPHERGDKINHYVKVRVNQMDAPQEAPVTVQCHGDVNVPMVDQYVLIGYRKGERPYILDQWYPIEDSLEGKLKSYEQGERILGHPSTDASLLFDKDGNIKLLNSSSMGNGRVDDIRTHDGNYISQLEEDIFVHADRDSGGSVYGIGDVYSGVMQAPDSPNTITQYDVGFQPRQIEFSAQLHQGKWNEPYYTAEDASGDMNEAMAECSGLATLTPMYVENGLNYDIAPRPSSETEPRPEEEPYTNEQLTNVTQQVSSKAWYANAGTDFRSYMGDDQCVRLIHGQDASMVEQGRVEARVTEFNDTGFELEWFMNDESGATWRSTNHPVTIHFKAYS